METKRSSFSGRLGFVLAAAGSAVGLGNIWRFPYLAAKYGGGIFLFVYVILAVTFGFTLAISEIAIGRKTGLSAIEAFKKLHHKYAFIGYLEALVPVLILPYYSVIGGWVCKYLCTFLMGSGTLTAAPTFFSTFTGQVAEPIFWLSLFIIITAVIVVLGVEKGVEKASRFLMPILVILTVGIALYAITLPGAWEGFLYYVTPDFSNFSFNTVIGAMGQLFYSMSIAMGILITYGSYMKKEVDMEKSVNQIEFFDTGIAFFAGMMVVPTVYAFSGSASGIKAGPGLMFETLPYLFNQMPMGQLVGTLFFLLVLFAAITSSISIMETIVSIISDKFKTSRLFGTISVTLFSIIVALPSTLGFGIWSHIKPLNMSFLEFFDFLANSVLMPIVAFCICVLVGYILKPQVVIDEIKQSSKFKREKLYVIMIKYIAPICVLLILITSILSCFGIMSI